MDLFERERQYSPSSCIGGNYAPFIAQYVSRSHDAHAQLPWRRDLPYAPAIRPHERTTFDLVLPSKRPSAQLPGLLVFIHGGYWQELSKNESAFLAPAWVEAGFAHAVVGYTLAPHASLAQIVAQCCEAIRYLHGHAKSLGFDADNMVVVGSSAGAYLAAAVGAKSGVPLRGIVPVSGVFDVAPLIGTSINEALGLDDAQAEALNLFEDRLRFPRTVVAVGEIETDEFKRQSRMFVEKSCAVGTTARCTTDFLEISARNHFDVIFEVGDAGSPLFAATRRLFKP